MYPQKRIKPVVGGVLSGGLSTRMGMPKDRIKLPDGRSMIQHVIASMLAVCNEVIVAGPELPLSVEETERVHFVKDNYNGQGPLGGIEAVLSTGLAKGYLIAACDQPLLNAALLRLLIPRDQDLPCFFDFSENGYIQPFPGYYPVKWLPEVRDALRRKRRAIKSLIAESDVYLRPIESDLAKRLVSINTMDDLMRILQAPRS